MNWLKRIFCSQEKIETDYNGLPKVTTYPPIPKVKPCKPEKDISEPVHAMVRSMSDRPHTWKAVYESEGTTWNFKHYAVRDIKTGLNFKVTEFTSYSLYLDNTVSVGLSWMTSDEEKYFCESLRAMQQSKIDRISRIRQIKKDIERNKVKELYK